jgi:hypothetical protein
MPHTGHSCVTPGTHYWCYLQNIPFAYVKFMSVYTASQPWKQNMSDLQALIYTAVNQFSRKKESLCARSLSKKPQHFNDLWNDLWGYIRKHTYAWLVIDSNMKVSEGTTKYIPHRSSFTVTDFVKSSQILVSILATFSCYVHCFKLPLRSPQQRKKILLIILLILTLLSSAWSNSLERKHMGMPAQDWLL